MSNRHGKCEIGKGLSVAVRGDEIEKAMKKFKKMIINEGFLKELKARQEYEKPSDKRRLAKKEAVRRQQKAIALRIKHDGY